MHEALRSFYGTRRLTFSFDTTVAGITASAPQA